MISRRQAIYTADAYACNDCRFTVSADGRLTTFLELRVAIQRQLGPKKSVTKMSLDAADTALAFL
jgi:hypothetical protein